jgi:2-methylcitrate dehydratase
LVHQPWDFRAGLLDFDGRTKGGLMATLADRMADWAVGVEFAKLPAPVVHEAKRRVIDSLGCAYGAWKAQPCVIARRVATRMSADPGATVFGTSHRAPPDWAAFANGCHVRYLDYNDTYLSKEPAHPSDNITAALAIAEAQKRPGKELITAIAIAYEVQCRLCDAASIRARGWDHVTYGALSTAIAAGKLLKLPADKMRHAIGIAGVASPNLRQSRAGELSYWKGCAFANAAKHGVYAAMLAAEGMTGPAPIFEGVFGFEKLVSGPLKLAGPFADSPNQWGGDFMINRTSIKNWPAEYHSQSAIDAALELRMQLKSVDDIKSIVIESHDASVDIIGSSPEQWKPQSRETADHSLPYITAAALADGEITDRQFERSRFTDPKLLELVAKIKVTRNAELSAKYAIEVGNIVNIKLKDGKTLSKRVDVPPGNAKRPLTDEQVAAKFHSMADEVIGKERAGKISDWVWRLDEKNDSGELMPLLVVK